jgi:hypothetical protein
MLLINTLIHAMHEKCLIFSKLSSFVHVYKLNLNIDYSILSFGQTSATILSNLLDKSNLIILLYSYPIRILIQNVYVHQ